MQLKALTAKPQLIKITLESQQVIDNYGEPVEFYTWDRQPIDVFMRLASAEESGNSSIIDLVKDLVLDDKGKPILTDGEALPTDLLLLAITAIVERLGKL